MSLKKRISMKKVLVVGNNTRPVACSAKKMGYKVYSVDYFGTKDLVKCSDNLRCVLTQKPFQSCGYYSKRYDPEVLQEYAHEVVDEVDYILCCTGAVPENFPQSKVIGNKRIKHVENKYNLYKMLKDKFNLPETFIVSSYQEAAEIAESFEDKRFMLKPLIGAGGLGIRPFEETNEHFDVSGFMLQEVIEGKDISASVLSTKNEAKTIFTSEQIIGNGNEEYVYQGNMVPYNDDPHIKRTAQEVIIELGLVGSNGVDMIENNNEIYIIEVNPRFQGTFECGEIVLGINMLDAHIKASNGRLIMVPEIKEYAVKMFVFAKKRSIVGDLNLKGVYDVPEKNVIIEEKEPAATVVSGGKTTDEAVLNCKKMVNKVYKSLEPYPATKS